MPDSLCSITMFGSGVEFVRLSTTFHFRGCYGGALSKGDRGALSKGARGALSNHRTFHAHHAVIYVATVTEEVIIVALKQRPSTLCNLCGQNWQQDFNLLLREELE